MFRALVTRAGAAAATSSVVASVALHGTALVAVGLIPSLVGRPHNDENAVEFEIRTIRVQAEPPPEAAPLVDAVPVPPVRHRAPVRRAAPAATRAGITPQTEGLSCPAVAAPAPAPILATPASAIPKGPVFGSGSGGVDAEDAMPAYLRTVYDRLVRRLVVPEEAEREGREGTVVVRLLVARDGALREASTVGDSVDPVLGAAALRAVHAAAPLPPLPRGLPGDGPISIRVPVRFVLR
jgi:periplasmic protein TonB